MKTTFRTLMIIASAMVFVFAMACAASATEGIRGDFAKDNSSPDPVVQTTTIGVHKHEGDNPANDGMGRKYRGDFAKESGTQDPVVETTTINVPKGDGDDVANDQMGQKGIRGDFSK